MTNALRVLPSGLVWGKLFVSSSSLFYLQNDDTTRLSELIFKAVTAGLERKETKPEVTCSGVFIGKVGLFTNSLSNEIC